jgi:hypothetical protein
MPQESDEHGHEEHYVDRWSDGRSSQVLVDTREGARVLIWVIQRIHLSLCTHESRDSKGRGVTQKYRTEVIASQTQAWVMKTWGTQMGIKKRTAYNGCKAS